MSAVFLGIPTAPRGVGEGLLAAEVPDPAGRRRQTEEDLRHRDTAGDVA